MPNYYGKSPAISMANIDTIEELPSGHNHQMVDMVPLSVLDTSGHSGSGSSSGRLYHHHGHHHHHNHPTPSGTSSASSSRNLPPPNVNIFISDETQAHSQAESDVASTSQNSANNKRKPSTGNSSYSITYYRRIRAWKVFPGRNRFFCNGRIIMAKQISVFYFTLTLLVTTCILFFVYDCPYLYINISPVIPIVGVLLFLFALFSLLRTSFTDPGIIPRATPEEAADVERQIVPVLSNSPTCRPPPRTKEVLINNRHIKLKYCFTCKIFRPPRASHCSLCDNCVERFDHHCPWVGNCVGKRNYRFFYMFIVSLSFLCLYVFSCTVTHIIYVAKELTFVDAIKLNPLSVLQATICFFSIWSILGLAGFHTYLITSNLTTNEDIKGSFSSKRNNSVSNPYSKGSALENFSDVLCSPLTPSLIKTHSYVYRDTIMTGTTENSNKPSKSNAQSNYNAIRPPFASYLAQKSSTYPKQQMEDPNLAANQDTQASNKVAYQGQDCLNGGQVNSTQFNMEQLSACHHPELVYNKHNHLPSGSSDHGMTGSSLDYMVGSSGGAGQSYRYHHYPNNHVSSSPYFGSLKKPSKQHEGRRDVLEYPYMWSAQSACKDSSGTLCSHHGGTSHDHHSHRHHHQSSSPLPSTGHNRHSKSSGSSGYQTNTSSSGTTGQLSKLTQGRSSRSSSTSQIHGTRPGQELDFVDKLLQPQLKFYADYRRECFLKEASTANYQKLFGENFSKRHHHHHRNRNRSRGKRPSRKKMRNYRPNFKPTLETLFEGFEEYYSIASDDDYVGGGGFCGGGCGASSSSGGGYNRIDQLPRPVVYAFVEEDNYDEDDDDDEDFVPVQVPQHRTKGPQSLIKTVLNAATTATSPSRCSGKQKKF